ncbi:MAG: DNA polymerase III subunit [Pirellulales bacterium]|nr:DNA polymerase III subunit [Pirellulales bacterium]
MWQGIYGHDEVLERFRRSVAHGRLASSYLLLGPAGVGKRSFALKLAKALLCNARSAAELQPCEACESCRLFEAGNHPDLDRVGLPAGKRWLPVELFIGDREHRHQEGLCHNVALRPMLGRRRVAIIEDADHLTTESSNCLLKTLEEPPPGAVLLLIGTSRARQLPTILSRTQIVRFQPLEVDTLRDLLIQHEIATDQSHADKLAAIAGGSIERAADLADPEFGEIQQRLLPQLDPSQFDSHRLVAEITEFVNKAGKEAADRRQRLRWVVQLLAGYYRQMMHGGCGASDTRCTSHTGRFRTEIALAALDRCLEAEIELDRNANQATLLECWLDDLAGIFLPASPASAD